jgi:hypothetical protein
LNRPLFERKKQDTPLPPKKQQKTGKKNEKNKIQKTKTKQKLKLKGWTDNCFLMPRQQFFRYIVARTSYV